MVEEERDELIATVTAACNKFADAMMHRILTLTSLYEGQELTINELKGMQTTDGTLSIVKAMQDQIAELQEMVKSPLRSVELPSTRKCTTGFKRKTIPPGAFIEAIRSEIPVGGHFDVGATALRHITTEVPAPKQLVVGKWVKYIAQNPRHGIIVAKSRNSENGTTQYRFSAI